MIQQHIFRAAFTLAVAVGCAVSTDPAHADLVHTFAYSFSSVSFDRELAKSLGISTYAYSYHDWYTNEDAVYTGDATYNTDSGTYGVGLTDAQSYASASGRVNTGAGVYSSSAWLSASAASYLYLYNNNPYDVWLPIRSYHYDYAYAFSDAHVSGGAYAFAQSFVQVANDFEAPYFVETRYALARFLGTSGLAGPFVTEEELFYEVRLAPYGNDLVSGASVETYGFVSVPSPVPEPGTLTLFAFGLVTLGGIACRRGRAEKPL